MTIFRVSKTLFESCVQRSIYWTLCRQISANIYMLENSSGKKVKFVIM